MKSPKVVVCRPLKKAVEHWSLHFLAHDVSNLPHVSDMTCHPCQRSKAMGPSDL